jgi:hypothetical protein
LLAKKFADLTSDEEDREIAAPVRIRLRVRLSQLADVSETQAFRTQTSASWAIPSLEQQLDIALRTALGMASEPSSAMPVRDQAPVGDSRFHDNALPVEYTAGAALPRLLLTWRQHNNLQSRLVALDSIQIAVWHDYLQSQSAGQLNMEPDSAVAAQIENLVLAESLSAAAAHLPSTVARRILIATEVSARFTLLLTDARIWRALDRNLPLALCSSTTSAVTLATSSAVPRVHALDQSSLPSNPPPPATRIETRHGVASRLQPAVWDTKISCAVPFLLLGPLARMGYLSTLAGVLEAANLTREAPLFGVALAYKVLDPPERGWQRSPASLLAASACTGLSETVKEERLIDFARRMAGHTGALDLTLADSLIAGHTPGDSVTLHCPDSPDLERLLVIDGQGCFPIASTCEIERLLDILRRLGLPTALVSAEAAQSHLLRELNAAGLTFLVDVPPSRGERWQRLQEGPTLLGWTNSQQPGSGSLRRAGRGMNHAIDEARLLTKELAQNRPAVIRALSSELDRSITLAAAVAMATIAWKLWQGRGRTTPLQVLERFSDLEARIRFEAKSIDVCLPLGRRRDELQQNGLLRPLEGVPWFLDRTVQFSGG